VKKFDLFHHELGCFSKSPPFAQEFQDSWLTTQTNLINDSKILSIFKMVVDGSNPWQVLMVEDRFSWIFKSVHGVSAML
jgi:hypothetical protein